MAIRRIVSANDISPNVDLVTRIEALERAVFGKKLQKTKANKALSTKDDFKGATGGLRFLLSKGFFDRRRQFSDIEKELNNHGYHYSKQAIQTPLNRLSSQRGPLVGLKEKGHKVYVRRK
jgi:hypothetical protein